MSDLTSPLNPPSLSGLSDTTTSQSAYGLNVTGSNPQESNSKPGGLTELEPELFGSNPNVDEVGNHWNEAQLLTPNQFQNGSAVVEDWIGVDDDQKDFFRFDVLVGGEVTVSLGGLTDNANLELSDANGKRIKASYKGGTQQDVIRRTLEAGTYHVSVFEKNSSVETPYTLNIQVPDSSPGISQPDTAQPDTAQTNTAQPDANEQNNNQPDPAPAPNSVPAPITSPEPAPETLITPEPAPAVTPTSTNPSPTPATLPPIPAPEPLPIEADASIDVGGNSQGEATLLNRTAGQFQVKDWVGVSQDNQDYYRFEVENGGDVTITLGDLADNANLQLFDASGKRLNASYKGGTQNDVIQRNLEAGTYYVRIFGKNSSVETDYTLSVETPQPPEAIAVEPIDHTPDIAPPPTPNPAPVPEAPPEVTPNPAEPNSTPAPSAPTPEVPTPPTPPTLVPAAAKDDTLESAQQLLIQNGQTEAQDSVGTDGDRQDYYRFELQESGEVTINLGNLSDNANLQLMNANGQRIKASYAGGTKNDVIQQTLEAGTYYLKVFGKTSTVETGYQLSVDAPFASDSVAPATTIPETPEPATLPPTSPLAEPTVNPTAEPAPSESPAPTPAPAPAIQPAPIPEPSSSIEPPAESTPEPQPELQPAPPSDVSDDSYATAQQLSFADGMADATDAVGFGSDKKDYYHFEIQQDGNVSITLSGLQDNANLALYDADGNRVKASYAGGTKDDVIAQNLTAGHYYVAVFEKNAEVETEYSLSIEALNETNLQVETDAFTAEPSPVFESAPTFSPLEQAPPQSVTLETNSIDDWFSQNIDDPELQVLARERFQDGKIDRMEMIELLRSVGDLNEVDGTEFEDLKTLVNASDRLKLDDHVRVLANKVVNGDRANQWYTGGERNRQDLGNLAAGSAQEKLDLLINKWFIGSDRPTTLSNSHQYRYIEGDLFRNGVDFKDVVQDRLGDCYFLVVLASAAQNNPEAIQDMFIDNGDGTFTIRFFKNGVADYVTVDRYLPTQSWNGKSPYSQFGSFGGDSNELWVALAEKAYAQINESGWIGQDNTNSYKGIEGGWMSKPTRQVLGTSSISSSISSARVSPAKMIELLDTNEIITVGIVGEGKHGVVDNHAYTLTSYDATTDTFHLENPWGEDHADLTWEQMGDMNLSFIWSDSN